MIDLPLINTNLLQCVCKTADRSCHRHVRACPFTVGVEAEVPLDVDWKQRKIIGGQEGTTTL